MLFSSIQLQQLSSISAVSGSASKAAVSHPSSAAARAGVYRQLELYLRRSGSSSHYAALVAASFSDMRFDNNTYATVDSLYI